MRYLCLSPVKLKSGIDVDCGTCRSCRAKRKSSWALRMYHQTAMQQSAFVTLTYAPEHLPKNCSLTKRDIQLWIKRLRKAIAPIQIKYFVAGEYGPKTMRPHYHAILMGLPIRCYPLVFTTWGKCDALHYKCEPVESVKAFGYVAGYVAKKLGSHYNERFAAAYPLRVPEFQLTSTGIGKAYAIANSAYLIKNATLRHMGKDISIPRYYRKILNITQDTPAMKKSLLDYQESIYQYSVSTGYVEDDTALPSGYPYGHGHYVRRSFFEYIKRFRKASEDYLKRLEQDYRMKIQ